MDTDQQLRTLAKLKDDGLISPEDFDRKKKQILGMDISPDRELRFIVPVGRSGYAIAAGYLALFSVLLIPAPFALLFGILAVNDIKKNPQKLGKGRAVFGIVMGAIFLPVGILMFWACVK